MKTKILLVMLAIFSVGAVQAGTPLSKYYGNWVNTDSGTRGIVKLVITANGTNPYMQVFGSCQPSDCDWGKIKSEAYSSSVSQNPATNAVYLKGEFNPNFAKSTVLVRPKGSTYLEVTVLTNFTDRSGRKSYAATYILKKSTQNNPVANCAKEDCLGMDPKGSLKVIKNSKGTYTVAQGSHYLFSAPTQAEAEKIIKIVRRYGFTNSCFVGRPNPDFTYQLAGGKTSKVQPASDEDIISFNPGKIEAKVVSGNWKIVEGNHWIFDFGKDAKEAKQALCVIRKYGFNAVGFVGRPNASFQYMVKTNTIATKKFAGLRSRN